MYNNNQVIKIVITTLNECLQRDILICTKTHLFNELMIDSMELIDILLSIEKKFGIVISNLDDVNTVGDLSTLILHHYTTRDVYHER